MIFRTYNLNITKLKIFYIFFSEIYTKTINISNIKLLNIQ